jgi:hypothetical protein
MIEIVGYLEFNRPAEGYLFDTKHRAFTRLPTGIYNATDMINHINYLGNKAQLWYMNLPWKSENELLVK